MEWVVWPERVYNFCMTTCLKMLLVSLLLLGPSSCGEQPESDRPVVKSGVGEPDHVMTNSEIYLTNNGWRAATIKSTLLKAYTRIDTTLLYTVEVQFFDSSGVQTSTLTADSGKVSQRTNIMSVTGHVLANTKDNRRLVSDSLRWDAKNDKVVTEGHVKVYRENGWISGEGLETDQRLSKVLIKRNLKGSFDEPKQ
jgi:LPS export ABC transporter protein LptC